MKKQLIICRFFTTLLFLAVSAFSWAYDFKVDGIYYDKNDDGTSVTVTYKTTSNRGYSGAVAIPSSVTYNDVVYSVTSIGYSAFSGCSSLTSVTIPNSVTSIGPRVFYDCSGLTSITIPESVTSIGIAAFYGCTSLPVIDNIRYADTYLVEVVDKTQSTYNIKNSTRFIGWSAFSGCSNLISITIPNKITRIDARAFEGCSGLTSITIPESVTSINGLAFSGCTGLTKAEFASVESLCNISFSDSYVASVPTLANPLCYAHHLYIDGQEVKDVVIPNSVTSIGQCAFDGCSGLTSITIPESVTSIGAGAFFGCSGLTSITIPKSVNSIETEAFKHCTGLSKAEFASIESLCTISFSDSYPGYFPSYANPLYYAHHLYIDGQEVKDVVIPNSVTNIGRNAFESCSSLTSITISNSVSSIGSSAFNGCSGLTSVTIPEGVTSIESSAFSACSGLTSVTIPEGVTSIGRSAFSGCSALTSVTCFAESIPTTGSDVFFNSPIGHAVLYVPESSVMAYKNADQWKEFDDILPIDVSVINVIKGNTEKEYNPNAPIYDLNGRRLNKKSVKGVFIQGGKKYTLQ